MLQGTSALPYAAMQRQTIHVRTTSQDQGPNAVVVAQAMSHDLPLALAVAQKVYASSALVPTELLLELVDALSNILFWHLTPPVRELVQHTLAALMRRVGRFPPSHVALAEKLGRLRGEINTLYEAMLKEAVFGAQASARFSTYAQSLFELVMANWEINDALVEKDKETPEPAPVVKKAYSAAASSTGSTGGAAASSSSSGGGSSPPGGRGGMSKRGARGGKSKKGRGGTVVPEASPAAAASAAPAAAAAAAPAAPAPAASPAQAAGGSVSPAWLVRLQQLNLYLRLWVGWSCGQHGQREMAAAAAAVEADDDLASEGYGRLAHSLVATAMAKIKPNDLARTFGIRNLPTTLSAAALRDELLGVANRFGGVYNNNVFIMCNDAGAPTGEAILELRSSVHVGPCKSALNSHKVSGFLKKGKMKKEK